MKPRQTLPRGIRRSRDSTKLESAPSGSPRERRGASIQGAANRNEVDSRISLWTVGHSTRSVSDFIALLQAHGIRQLVDVRTIPRSRHNPQFNQDSLSESLRQSGIRYLHMPSLGGLRHAHRDSVNTAWRNASFRGYADYMQTEEFDRAIQKLLRLARRWPAAIMCAEAVPWRCHRSLIADALLVRGVHVEELTSRTSARPHRLTPWARVDGQRITYPPQEEKSATTGNAGEGSADGKAKKKSARPISKGG